MSEKDLSWRKLFECVIQPEERALSSSNIHFIVTKQSSSEKIANKCQLTMMRLVVAFLVLQGVTEAFSPSPPMRRGWSIKNSSLRAAQRTLASDYVISTEGDTWSAYAIDNVITKTAPEGEKAVSSLRQEWGSDVQPSFTLSAAVQDKSATITLEGDDIDDSLVAILSRVLIQGATEHQASSISSISLPNEQTMELSSMKTEEGVLGLFAPLIGSTENVEVSEMVDQDGKPLGMVPRKLVHKANLLHRGIGMVVTKDESVLSPQCTNFPELYVHRRTDDKRIFPSLYDMFVGGVSTAGEDSKTTAAREVAEELGLERALSDPNMLSDPLFDCTVCTSYNRCVVTMFCCMFDSAKDSVTWQEEEVAWGDFVDYDAIVASADLCIHRMIDTGTWPGSTPIDMDARMATSLAVSNGEDVWKKWDYVPDGLLVWEAWLDWQRGGK